MVTLKYVCMNEQNLKLSRSELKDAENGVPELLLVWDESVVQNKTENAMTQVSSQHFFAKFG